MFEFVRGAKADPVREAPKQQGPRRWRSEFINSHRNGWCNGLPVWAEMANDSQSPVVIAIGSGKGGVGKSLVSANMGAAIAAEGWRVLVIDLDIGCANLHTYFGSSHPSKTIDDFLGDPQATLRSTILSGPIKGLGYIAGGRQDETMSASRFTSGNLERLWLGVLDSWRTYDIDFVIIDLGAGTHAFTLELFCLAHVGVVTVLPEPTSIENAYVFLKSYLLQLVRNIGRQINQTHEAEALCSVLTSLTPEHLDQGYLAAIRSQYHHYPDVVRNLGTAIMARKLGLLINQAREREDRDIGKSMEGICRRFFGFQAADIGYLNYDEAAWRSLRNQRLLVSDFPHNLIVKRLNQASRKLLELAK